MSHRRLLLVPDVGDPDVADEVAIALLELDGVDHVEVDLDRDRIELDLDPDAPIEDDEIEASLEDLGLRVDRIEVPADSD